MLRCFIKKSIPIACGMFPLNFDKAQTDSVKGWAGIKRMYTVSEFGDLSPELQSSIQIGCFGLFVGALYGGFTHSRLALTSFLENNQATAFQHHFEAKKALQDKMMLAYAKGAFKFGWRLGAFSMMYMLFSSSASAYRGKTGILDFAAGGAITGGLYKIYHGPKAFIVGIGLGGVLGLIAGSATVGILKLGGISMDEVRYFQYNWTKMRRGPLDDKVKERLHQEDTALMKERELADAKTQSLEQLAVTK